MWFAPSDSNHVKLTSFMLIKSKLTSFLLSLYMFPTLTNSLFMMVSRVLFTNIAIFYNTFGRKLFFSNPKRIKKNSTLDVWRSVHEFDYTLNHHSKMPSTFSLKISNSFEIGCMSIHHNANNYFT